MGYTIDVIERFKKIRANCAWVMLLRMLAVLNNCVLGLLALQGEGNVAHARRQFASHLDRALQALVASSLPFQNATLPTRIAVRGLDRATSGGARCRLS